MTWFTVPLRAFTLMSGEPTAFSSSDHGTRTFCPRCGTPLTFSSRKTMDEIDVTTASLDEAEKVPPKLDIFVGNKLPWVVLDEDLPSFVGERLA